MGPGSLQTCLFRGYTLQDLLANSAIVRIGLGVEEVTWSPKQPFPDEFGRGGQQSNLEGAAFQSLFVLHTQLTTS